MRYKTGQRNVEDKTKTGQGNIEGKGENMGGIENRGTNQGRGKPGPYVGASLAGGLGC